jgi:pimeloyl-ACP methyl ester carboxylesterase
MPGGVAVRFPVVPDFHGLTTGALGLLVLSALAGCHHPGVTSSPLAPEAAAPTPSAPLDDGMVDAGGGVSLHVDCAGDGSPLVLLDECGGCDAGSWREIQPRIASFTRVCAYDRAGVGYSGPAPKPHRFTRVVDELHGVLLATGQPGPVVLVGQGLGGFIAQRYASDHPRDVAGMVLVDAGTQDYDRYWSQFPPDALAALQRDMRASSEGIDYDEQARAMASLRAARWSLGDRPLVVVSHGKTWDPLYGIPVDAWGKLEAVWREVQAELPGLSANSTHVVAPDAAWIPTEAPDLVVTSVWNVVSSARTGVPLRRLPPVTPPSGSAPLPLKTVPRPGGPVDDGLVDIGGGASLHFRASLHIHCVGSGAPTVVMEAGLGDPGAAWHEVQGNVGRVTRTCVYDRLGLGLSSGPAPRPHPIRQMASELHTLLERAGAAPPYVLVGHSMGGVSVRLFAIAHPEETAGMVLVDSSTEEQPARFWALLGEAEMARYSEGLARGPDGLDYGTFLGGLAELRTSAASLGDRPLVVLTSGRQNVPPGTDAERAARIRESWKDLQRDLLHLSTNAAQIVAERSRHYIQWDAPELVVASVLQVVQAVRTRGRVDASALHGFEQEGPPDP